MSEITENKPRLEWRLHAGGEVLPLMHGALSRGSLAIWLLLVLMILVEIVARLSYGEFSLRLLTVATLGLPTAILGGVAPLFPAQPYTMFLTYGLAHSSFMHLASNFFLIASFGFPVKAVFDEVDRRRGSPRFLPGSFWALTLGASVAGGMAFAISRETSILVGASTAGYAMMGAWCSIEARLRHCCGTRQTGLILFAGAIVLASALEPAIRGNVSWEGHMAGFLVGLAAAWAIAPGPRPEALCAAYEAMVQRRRAKRSIRAS